MTGEGREGREIKIRQIRRKRGDNSWERGMEGEEMKRKIRRERREIVQERKGLRREVFR